jgi:hypothetical protein
VSEFRRQQRRGGHGGEAAEKIASVHREAP